MVNYNTRQIKSRRSYNITEMALLLGKNRKTCQRWIRKNGLRVIERDVSPLIMGIDLINFLKEKNKNRKTVLKEDEFFCMKCHRPVKARIESEETIKTGKRMGKNNMEQFKKIGVCEICGTKLNRFLKSYSQD